MKPAHLLARLGITETDEKGWVAVPEPLLPMFLHRSRWKVTDPVFLRLVHEAIKRSLSVPVTTVESTRPSLWVIVKVTIRNHVAEDHLLAFHLDPETDAVTTLPLSSVPLSPASVASIPATFSAERVEAEVGPLLKQEVITLLKARQSAWHDVMNRDLKRIKEYFLLAQREHQQSYTESSFADFELVLSERDRLIQATLHKYRYKLKETTSAPVLYVIGVPAVLL